MDMEQVFFRIHVRLSQALSSIFPSSALRGMVQLMCLMLLVLFLAALTFLHRLFVSSNATPVACLAIQLQNASLALEGGRVDILRVRVLGPTAAMALGVPWERNEDGTLVEEIPNHVWYHVDGVDLSMERGLLELEDSSRQRLGVRGVELRIDARWPRHMGGKWMFGGFQRREKEKEDALGANVRWDVVKSIVADQSCLGPPIGMSIVDMIGSLIVPVSNAAVHAFSGRGFIAPIRLPQVFHRAKHIEDYTKQWVSKEEGGEGGGGGGGGGVQSGGGSEVNRRVGNPRVAWDGDSKRGSIGIRPLGPAADVENMTQYFGTWLAFKVGTVCSAMFLLFAASSLVSFVLAETQRRMLSFTVSLQHAVRTRRPLASLVLRHSTDSLVFVPIMLGVLFFLFEFFADQTLASAVLSTVWFAEIFSILSARTLATLRIFPRVYLIVMTWFLGYYFSFPFGFHFLALVAAICGMICCMFALWVRYELPALQLGLLTEQQPRHISLNPAHTTPGTIRRLESVIPDTLPHAQAPPRAAPVPAPAPPRPEPPSPLRRRHAIHALDGGADLATLGPEGSTLFERTIFGSATAGFFPWTAPRNLRVSPPPAHDHSDE